MSARDSARVLPWREHGWRDLRHMNFRLVWVGADDDPDGQQLRAREASTNAGGRASRELSYELRGKRMVRRERLENGRVKCTPVANFSARIVSDIILEDDGAEHRNFARTGPGDG